MQHTEDPPCPTSPPPSAPSAHAHTKGANRNRRALTPALAVLLATLIGCQKSPAVVAEEADSGKATMTSDASFEDAAAPTNSDDASVDSAQTALVDGSADTNIGADAGTDGASSSPSGSGDASVDSATDSAPAIATPVYVDASEAVTLLSVSPLNLVPSFSTTIEDYYVRCAPGANALDLTVTTSDASVTTPLSLVPDQAAVVNGQYWIRCLPNDIPAITVTTVEDGGPTPGYYLVNTATYAIVLDTNGTPVWYARGPSMGDVDALSPNTISFIPNGTGPFGYELGSLFEVDSLDAGTGTMTSVTAVGTPTDGHEFRLLSNGDHLVWTYLMRHDVDLTGLLDGGVASVMADCEIQEIDPWGNLVWSWLASDHVDPVQESLEPALDVINGEVVMDVFHFNAIDVDTNGNLLLSSRHTNALFYVDRATGAILWKLGGTAYNKDGAQLISVVNDPEGAFCMQHDARLLPNGDVSLFDDHGASAGLARGVEYSIDFGASTATPVFQFEGIAQSEYEGSFRRYADGHSVIGWGYVPGDPRVVTEVDENGYEVFDISFLDAGPSYRAIKVPTTQLDIGLLRATTPQ